MNRMNFKPKRKNRRRAAWKDSKLYTQGKQGRVSAKFSARTYIRPVIALCVVLLLGYLGVHLRDLANLYNGLKIKDKLPEESGALIDHENSVFTNNSDLVVFEKRNGDSSVIEAVLLFIHNERSGSTLVFYIPGWVYVSPYFDEVSEDVSLGNIHYLGQLVDEEKSYQFTVQEVSNVTAMQISSYIWIGPDAVEEIEGLQGKEISSSSNAREFISQNFSSLSMFNLLFKSSQLESISKSVYSNLSAVDLYSRLNLYSGNLNSSDVHIIDLSEEWATQKVTLESGKSVQKYNASEIDGALEEYYSIIRDREVEKEQVKVEVYNGSEGPGLAARYARVVKNSGMTLVRADNTPDSYEKTTVYISNSEKFGNSLSLLLSMLPVEPDVVEGRPEFLTTGDIVLVLGSDLLTQE